MDELSNILKMLSELKDRGYKNISICKGHIAGLTYEGDYFSDDLPYIGGWPAIWYIVEKYGYASGCGNGHQRQMGSTKWNIAVNSLYDVYIKADEKAKNLMYIGPFPNSNNGTGYKLDLNSIENIRLIYGSI